MNRRIEGYDFIRSFAILIVFLGHILGKQATNEGIKLVFNSLSPGLTMSLLGFISAVLLSSRNLDVGSFLIKRFTRIYISLFYCLILILCAHLLLGKEVVNQHMLLHFMGLSAFFDLFLVKNKATIGYGLWFITAINLMYLFLPLLQKIFRHDRGLSHLAIFVILCTMLNFTMYGTSSIWNVVISFSVGVYFGVNGLTDRLIDVKNKFFYIVGCIILLFIVALSTSRVLPYETRQMLFFFYPLAFVPMLFAISAKIPKIFMNGVTFFAGLSYEFYILHFYFINESFKDFFSASIPLYGQIAIAFFVTLALACMVSMGASQTRKILDSYLLNSHGDI